MSQLKCLVCSKYCLPEDNNTEKSLKQQFSLDCEGADTVGGSINNQLEVIFLIRKILEIPEDICCNILRDFGDPTLWYCICTACFVLVDKSRSIFNQLVVFKQRYEKLQAQIQNAIVLSVNSEEKEVENDMKCGVREIVRSYVRKAHNIVTDHISEANLKISNVQHFNICENDDSASLPGSPMNLGFTQSWNIEDASLLKDETFDCNDIGLEESDDGIDEDDENTGALNLNTIDVHEEKFCNSAEIVKDEKPDVIRYKKKLRRRSKIKMRGRNVREESPLECEICDKSFSSSSNLYKHIRAHNEERSHKCDYCGKSFKQKSGLNDHLKTHTGEKTHICYICGKSCSLATNLRKHILRMHSNADPLGNGKTGASSSEKQSHSPSAEKPYECDICRKSYTKKCHLKDHQMVHTGEKPYVCEICGYSCSVATNLRKHIKRMHNDVDLSEIEDGIKKFKESRKSRKNKSRIRVKVEKNLKCDVCGKPFSNPNKLENHIITHSGGRPFQCDLCGKSYSKKSHLKDHQMVHTGEKNYVCDICGNRFNCSSNLRKHNRTHTGERPFECKTCGKTFTQAGNLNQHLRVHTGEKPYTCDICGKSFIHANYLKYHGNSHTGERPFQCELCGKSYAAPSYLRKHRIRAHQATATVSQS